MRAQGRSLLARTLSLSPDQDPCQHGTTIILAVKERLHLTMDWILVVTALLVLLASWSWWTYTYFHRKGVTFVTPVPILGNMSSFALRTKSASDVIKDLYRILDGHSFGGMFSFARPILLLRDPEIIRAVTVKDFEHFSDHVTFISDTADPIFGKSLFALRGQKWKDMRNTLSPAFTSSKMKSMFLLMNEIGQQMTNYLQKEVQENKESKKASGILTVDTKEFFTFVTNDIIATTAFGIKVDSLANPKNDFYLMGKLVTNPSSWRIIALMGFFLMPNVMKLLGIKFIPTSGKEFFLDLITKTIETREKEGIVRPDMIHLLMQARKGELEREDNTKQEKANLTDIDIGAQAITFFFAGFDTISTLMSFTTFLLACNKDIQTKLQAEVDDVMNECDGKLSYENVQGMKYLDMVVNETLRMYPPNAAVDRECVKAYQMPDTSTDKGYLLQPGEILWIPIHGIQHDPQYFPNPDKFDPERFSTENKSKIQPFTFLPFGIGPRVCIAQRFAILETKVVLVYLLSKFNLVRVPKTVEKICLENKGFNVGIKGGAFVGLQIRN